MGRILMIEFDDRDTAVFDEIMRTLEEHPGFEQFRLRDESAMHWRFCVLNKLFSRWGYL